jgi:hypothetical protein
MVKVQKLVDSDRTSLFKVASLKREVWCVLKRWFKGSLHGQLIPHKLGLCIYGLAEEYVVPSLLI